jgi:type I restriction enzyme S subunit
MTWAEIAIGDLGRVVTGDTPPRNNPEYYGHAYPFIKPTDMTVGQRSTMNYEEGYSEEGFAKYRKKLISAGSTAVVTIGSIGQKLTLLHTDSFVNQAVNAVVPDRNKFDCLYVYYLLKHNLNLVKQADTGASSGRENVSKSNFAALKVWACLDPTTQKQIAEVFDAFDSSIETNQRRITLLEDAGRRLYREWFVQLRFPGHESVPVKDGLPEGWSIENLSGVAEVNKRTIGTKDRPDSILYIDISSVTSGLIGEATPLAFADSPGRARRRVVHGDVIWSCVRPNRRSYSLIWEPNEKLVVSTGFAVLSALKVPFSFLYFTTTTDEFVGYLEQNATGATYPAVTAKTFEDAELVVPDLALLASFDKVVQPVIEQMEAVKAQNAKLAQVRDLLLPLPEELAAA